MAIASSTLRKCNNITIAPSKSPPLWQKSADRSLTRTNRRRSAGPGHDGAYRPPTMQGVASLQEIFMRESRERPNPWQGDGDRVTIVTNTTDGVTPKAAAEVWDHAVRVLYGSLA